MGGGLPKRQFAHSFDEIISLENLLLAWQEFIKGKRHKRDVQEFQFRLMDNIISLHEDLTNQTYHHGFYHHFKIADPKPRDIHKASVRDRLVHHAIYRILYPYFDRTFIADSFSCRRGKGMHKALERFKKFSYIISKNNARTCWVLKCDIKKFFASIDHDILFHLVRRSIYDRNTQFLLKTIIESFDSCFPRKTNCIISHAGGVGLPLGNLTSQLLVNIYMNEFDRHVKHTLKAKYYIRYADDFVFLSESKSWLESLIPRIQGFLKERLKLELHPTKLFIKTLASGVDFLGWVHFRDHRVLRTTTKRRMLRSLKIFRHEAALQSYLGLLQHGNTHKIKGEIFEFPDRRV